MERRGRHPRGPEECRRVARELGYVGANALYVLSRNHDPYAKGTPAHVRDAEWFKELWEAFGVERGGHLRRLHYWADAKNVVMPTDDGSSRVRYENTVECDNRLNIASQAARILHEVDAEAFTDRRNDPPRIYREPSLLGAGEDVGVWNPSGTWRLPEADEHVLATVRNAITDMLEIREPVSRPLEVGYDARFDDDPPVIQEVWIEKSTMDDVLDPLCREERVNFARATGFESITHTIELIRRCEQSGKPAHILYVSDFDPAGDHMPVAVARQLQYWLDVLKSDAVITLEQVALTLDQVQKYDLPRKPIKESDLRREGFEDRRGEGAVELDAIEALHPGELARIVRDAIHRNVDDSYRGRLTDVRRDASDRIKEAWSLTDGPTLAEEAAENCAAAREVLAGLADEIAELVTERLDGIDDLRERNAELADEAASIVDGLDVDLPDLPEAEIVGVDDGDVLFDSARHWLDQLEVFRARQNGDR